ncbi:hypothetical protein [Nocardioides immobilis]|uniref:hypothetical protein n=1 Tax=Nocardioides immobilis TaxID=2049295 RepID=UPI0015F8572D|nr:hypothetical protein [Nocardioides immobilis]
MKYDSSFKMRQNPLDFERTDTETDEQVSSMLTEAVLQRVPICLTGEQRALPFASN